MTMILQWRQARPPLTFGWRGPDGRIAHVAAANSPNLIPTLIGPPGVQGPAGPEGPLAEIIDGGTFS